jgi:hypothetical protein
MPPTVASALPTKRFFIDNITRDLSLEDAILDLVDNSIDAFVRTHDVDVSHRLLTAPELVARAVTVRRDTSIVQISITEDEIVVRDHCGGIDIEHAKDNVFRFGKSSGQSSTLGVYGIGLKRAIFKMGRDVAIESRTINNGFDVRLDVDQWAETDDWTIPLTPKSKVKADAAGTTITVQKLTAEVQMRIGDGTLVRRLETALATTYSLFLEHFFTISLNGKPVTPRKLPLAGSNELAPAYDRFEQNEIEVDLMAGLAGRVDEEWQMDTAGWYVLCNGRVVVSADKTELTGWGLGLPQFVPKHRGFIGVAFFFSKRPENLPWTTTKRGLNREAEILQAARGRMAAIGRPVLSFINSMYGSEPTENLAERQLVVDLQPVDVRAVVQTGVSKFSPPPRPVDTRKATVSVQFEAAVYDVNRIKKKLNKPRMGASAVGRYTFEYFLKVECPE